MQWNDNIIFVRCIGSVYVSGELLKVHLGRHQLIYYNNEEKSFSFNSQPKAIWSRRKVVSKRKKERKKGQRNRRNKNKNKITLNDPNASINLPSHGSSNEVEWEIKLNNKQSVVRRITLWKSESIVVVDDDSVET